MAFFTAKLKSFSTFGPFALMFVSMFFLKLRASAGTESITCGRVSRMATGTFFRVASAFLPIGTKAMLPPYDISVYIPATWAKQWSSGMMTSRTSFSLIEMTLAPCSTLAV